MLTGDVAAVREAVDTATAELGKKPAAGEWSCRARSPEVTQALAGYIGQTLTPPGGAGPEVCMSKTLITVDNLQDFIRRPP